MSETPDARTTAEQTSATARNLFDLRTIIGGLFSLYGVFLMILGAFDSPEEIEKAAGVRINLWAGLGMLVLGLIFLTWVFLRPLTAEAVAEATAAKDD